MLAPGTSAPLRPVIVALVIFAAGLVLRLLLQPLLGSEFGFMFFIPAVGAAAWLGGRKAGLIVTLLSALAVWYWWLPEFDSFRIADLATALHLLAFVAIGTGMAYFLGEGQRALRALRAAQTREAALRQDYEVTLRSIGDAVIATDRAGRITFMNAVAERLTGWSFAATAGKSIETVFAIISEETRARIPSPVHRALSDQRVIGLHNHTLLVTRSGSEIPIADSAAPIFDSGGALRGVVLVFHDMVEQAAARRALQAANAELEQQITDLRRLQEWSWKVYSASGLEQMFEEVLRAALEVSATDQGLISVVADGQDGLKVAASHGFTPEFLRHVQFVPSGNGACGWCHLTRQRVVIQDVTRDPRFEGYRSIAQAGGFRAAHSTPLATRDGKLIGVLSVHFKNPHHPGEREMRLMDLYARNVADLIENAQLREQLQRELEVRRATAEELARTNQDLEERVRERTVTLTDLLAQMETFSYTVSHDLRSPLRAIVGFAEVLKDDYGARLDATGRDLLDRIMRGGERMSRLINDVLAYARVNRDRVERTPVSIEDALRQVVQHAPELQPPKAIIRIPQPLPRVLGNEAFFHQVLANVLGNAVKFVPEGRTPEVEIIAERRGDFVRVIFADNGIGIKPEHQARLFGLFERLNVNKRYEGTGMGLAIVRRAVERMGGTVGVESDGQQGTRIWLDLLPAPAPPNGAAPPSISVIALTDGSRTEAMRE